jgi:hypothetical protein
MGKKVHRFSGWMALPVATACLFLCACASLVVPTPPAGQVRATIVEYGIYTNLVVTGRSEGPAGEWRLTGQEHVRTTTQIPFAEGTAFGFRFRLEGEPDPDAIDFVVGLPTEDGSHMPQGLHFRRTAAETRAKPFIGYLLEPGEPMLYGTYSMVIIHDGIALCAKQFEVLPPGTEPPPEPTP